MRIPVAAVAALLAWMLPAAADGAVVQVDGTAAVFTAEPGEQNEPYIFGRAGGGITVAEFAAPIEPGFGCHYTQDEHWIDCPGPIALVRVHLGDGDDFVQVDDLPAQAYGEDGHDYLQSATALPVRFEGGPGDDQLFSGDGADVLIGGAGQNDFRAEGGDDELIGGEGLDIMWGGPGDDRLEGHGALDELFGHDSWGSDDRPDGDDVLLGGAGSDYLDGEGGSDEMEGGEGWDLVRYLSHETGVHADLEGDADDGAPAEGDRIAADVESLQGGGGDDELIGDGGDGHLVGWRGDDTLIGGRGSDSLWGDDGDDRLFGDFEDHAAAGGAPDVLTGGVGADEVVGGGGSDTLEAEEGDDSVDARDPAGAAAESAGCGPGRDEALLDDDDVPVSCERVNGEDAPPPPPSGAGGWEDPIRLTPEGTASFAGEIGITSLGEALAVWEEADVDDPFPMRLRSLAVPAEGGPGAPEELAPELSGSGLDLATDGAGGAIAAWTVPDGDVHAAHRGATGGWADDVVVGGGSAWPTAAMSFGGAAAVAWSRWTQGGTLLEASVRTPAGVWTPPRVLASGLASAPERALAVTDAGDVYVLWRDDDTGAITFGGRTATGEPVPQEVLAERDGHRPQLALDGAGNAVAMWTDGGDGFVGVAVAERAAGGTFGAPEAPPSYYAWEGALGVDRSGRKTVVVQNGIVDVSSSRFGQPLELVAQFRTLWHDAPLLAVSPGGEAIVGWRLDHQGHWVTTRRSGDGEFGPVEDLVPDCDRAEYVGLAIADTGRAAAGRLHYGVRWLSVGTAPEPPPRQACAEREYYDGRWPEEEQPPEPGLPVQLPPAGDRVPLAAPRAATTVAGRSEPPHQTGAEQPARPVVRGLSLRRTRSGLVARLRVTCPSRCSVRGSVSLRRGRGVVARGRVAPRAFTGTRIFSVPLRRRASAGFARGRRRAELRARLTVTIAGARPVLRVAAPVGRARRR